MHVTRLNCPHCEAQFDFAEKVGTTCPYVDFCPGCGGAVQHSAWESVELSD